MSVFVTRVPCSIARRCPQLLVQRERNLLSRQGRSTFWSGSSPPRMPSTTQLVVGIGIGVVATGCVIAYNKQKDVNAKVFQQLHTQVMTARDAVQAGKYEEALNYYKEARYTVNFAKMSTAEVQSKIFINIVDQLGHLAYELEHWDEAATYLDQAEMAMLQSDTHQDDDTRFQEVQIMLAVIDTKRGRKADALKRFNACITTLEKTVDEHDTRAKGYSRRLELYGLAMTEYATHLKEIGELQSSKEAFSKVLNICQSVLGPTHEQTSVLYNDLATVHDELGEFDEAIRAAKKAIKIAKKSAPHFLDHYESNLAQIRQNKVGKKTNPS